MCRKTIILFLVLLASFLKLYGNSVTENDSLSGDGMLEKAQFALNKQKYKEAVEYSNKALLKNLISEEILVQALLVKAFAYTYLGCEDSAGISFEKANIILKTTEASELNLVYFQRFGKYQYFKANYLFALESYYSGLELSKELENQSYIAEFYKNIGIVLNAQGKFKKSFSLLQKSNRLFKEIGDTLGMIKCNVLEGDNYFSRGKYDSALIWTKRSLLSLSNTKYSYFEFTLFLSLGEIYLHLNQLDSALYYLTKSLDGYSKLELLDGKIKALQNIALVYSTSNQPNKALKKAHEALELSLKTKAKKNIIEVSELISEIYSELNDFSTAFKYRSLSSSTKDSLNSDVKSQLMAELETQYDKHALEETISRQKKSNDRLLLLMVAILSFGILFLFIFIGNRKTQRKLSIKNSEIILQKNLISEQNEELRVNSEELTAQTEELRTQAEDLFFHKENLEVLVEKRTSDLVVAKEKAEESNQLKTSFLNNISHEFRTPMNGILGFSALLISSDSSEEEQLIYANMVDKSCKQLLNIVTDTVEISKVHSSQIQIVKSNTNLLTLIETAISDNDELIKQKDLVVTFKINLKEDQLSIFTDHDKVSRVFWHIINNAVKFTLKGSVFIKGEMLENSFIQFQVKDTGIGILPEFQDKIFKTFRQVETGVAREFGGNGIGLSLSKAYIEKLGGKLWIKSEFEKGTTVFFTLPAEKKIEQIS